MAAPSSEPAPEDRALVERYLAHVRVEKRLALRTQTLYTLHLNDLLARSATAGVGVLAVDSVHVRRWVAALHAAGHVGHGIALTLSVWRGFYTWLGREGLVRANPVQGIRAPKQQRSLPKALGVDDAMQLANYVAADADPWLEARDEAMVELLYGCGLRVGELVGLDVAASDGALRAGRGWIDLDGAEVQVQGKGSKRRTVPLGHAAIASLRKWLALRPSRPAQADAACALFLGQRGTRLTTESAWKRLRTRSLRAGLATPVHPHMLRHSYASHVLQSSGDLRGVQELLGHANIATTQIYTRLDFQHLAKEYDAAHPRAHRKDEPPARAFAQRRKRSFALDEFMSLIPVTILTGFLGAGKTTLLQRVLHEAHGQKIAVIENEFGEENIDNEILVQEAGEQIIQMSNGCVCCTMREDLRATLQLLAAKRRKGLLDFERVILETTGLADPGPVAQTFFLDDEVAESFLLDSIITLVDAKHAPQQLDERLEAQRQVGFADQIFISKAELVGADELRVLQTRLTHMNPRAPQRTVHFGAVALADVLDLRGFNLNATLDIDSEFLQAETHDHDHVHEREDHAGHAHHHHTDDDVKSFVFRAQRPFDPARLEDFLGSVVNIYGPRMLRYKGVLWMTGTERKVVFQGVHQLMGSDLGPAWGGGETRESKLVFIGIDLPRDILVQGLEKSLN